MWGPRSRDQVRAVLAKRARTTMLKAEGQTLVLAMILRDAGTLVGDVNLHWSSGEHRQGEIGFVLHPDHHGKGFAGEAAAAMLRLGFEGLGLHRIVGRCDARNRASAKVMERLGMRREAYFRQNEIVKGEWTDELVYAMLADEWPAARGSIPR
jgi:RimJ/RimL family protein N-acetyltransferase